MDITVVIPTYNGAQRISGVLERLIKQQVPANLQWEVVVVNNNSNDALGKVVQRWQQAWPKTIPLRYVLEPKQGLAFARQCGVEQAAGELVGFLDDDNLPAVNWVAAACQFAQGQPCIGAFGSQVVGQFETPPTPELQPILFYLAINQRGDSPLKYSPAEKGVPPGAGLVVRRQAWLNHVPKSLLLVGRVNQSMLSGEDAEALLHLHRAGWEIWYNPAMKIDHCIPSDRLQWSYLRRNLHGIGLSRYYLRMLALKHTWQRPIMTLLYGMSDSIKLLRHLLKHKGQVSTEGLANCEWMLLLGTLFSPLYLLYVWLKKPRIAVR
ncbi:hormogonium polysaccharide biosynthesis glycosyltransferase HpsE [Oscillatoria sp. CS-180]|uniref:hormogonium polysaccharide biosynthesis glycosyltransferase HpsE n=1 Tax=Oscillatoria sp. CS-180 TaxID=3021720 RepID=UPI00232F2EC5|nr:hormogonium polysaccharide biosynthesis glycosyltransferase HpsE [Oscillatoria sp. CS-180]MDB9529816.1 hormogonium polysaccharide biosynthesis glycosyltransferase HpsE [Oscillatoria sp. CS-180]